MTITLKNGQFDIEVELTNEQMMQIHAHMRDIYTVEDAIDVLESLIEADSPMLPQSLRNIALANAKEIADIYTQKMEDDDHWRQMMEDSVTEWVRTKGGV